MRKIIAAMNMTLDGFCDHQYGVVDDELHQHYTDLLKTSDTILYGRITFELMTYWQMLIEKPSGVAAEDDFAQAIQKINKIVFSNTITNVAWDSADVADKSLFKTVADLKASEGTDVFVGSPSLIAQLTEKQMIDEYQICIHPVIAGSGLPLFNGLKTLQSLEFIKSKQFKNGSMLMYYRLKD
jgi:dihydrofolate reductase